MRDQFGNYVVQHVLQHGAERHRSELVRHINDDLEAFSQHKFASNVVEKSIDCSTEAQRTALIDTMLTKDEETGNAPIKSMMKDQFANYVVQKVIDKAAPHQRAQLTEAIKAHAAQLKRFTYGKHILSRLEKLGESIEVAPEEQQPDTAVAGGKAGAEQVAADGGAEQAAAADQNSTQKEDAGAAAADAEAGATPPAAAKK